MGSIVDVKYAVDRATAYFSKLMAPTDIRLEEVEISDGDRFWLVTLSALVPAQKAANIDGQIPLSALATIFKPDTERVYKVFTVDASTGDVRSMKIRPMP
jgi:hypothetical protein